MKARLRWLAIAAAFVTLVVGVVYGLSLLNSQRYYLVVQPGLVEVGRGRMFPVGHEPFVPQEPGVRRAYESFELPGGLRVPEGTTMYLDRVQFDQALYRLLMEASRFALANDSGRSADLVEGYLKRLGALPGVSIEQQVELQRLRGEASFARGRDWVRQAIDALEKADRAFKGADRSESAESVERWAERARRARRVLAARESAKAPRGSGPSTQAVTSTTATATVAE